MRSVLILVFFLGSFFFVHISNKKRGKQLAPLPPRRQVCMNAKTTGTVVGSALSALAASSQSSRHMTNRTSPVSSQIQFATRAARTQCSIVYSISPCPKVMARICAGQLLHCTFAVASGSPVATSTGKSAA